MKLFNRFKRSDGITELGLEKYLLEHFLQYKQSYIESCKKFREEHPKLPDSLSLNLMNEQGLAEIARKQGSLFQYSAHKYRQIEGVFNELFDLNGKNGAERKKKLKILEKIFDRIEKGSASSGYEFTSKSDSFELELKDDPTRKRFVKKGEKIGQMSASDWNESKGFIKVISKNGKAWIGKYAPNTVQYQEVSINNMPEGVQKLGDLLDGNPKVFLRPKEQELIFKWCFYYNGHYSKGLSTFADSIDDKPQLNAFLMIKHYRDLAQHNIASKKSVFDEFKGVKKTPEDLKYMTEPHKILESNYFDRYVTCVIDLYNNFLYSPEF